MNFTVEEIEKQFDEQTKNLENIEEKIKASYEERILINEITEFIQQNRDLEAEIEECNKKIIQTDSYNLHDLKNEKKAAIEKLRELKKYQKYLEEHQNENTPKSNLVQQLKVENIKKTNDYLIQKNEIVSITRNLIDVCEETITDLRHQNGKSVDLSKLFSEFGAVEKNIKSFDKYNNILSRKNALELEQLKIQKKCIIEQLKDKLPNLGEMIVESVKQNMYEEERERVLKAKQENNEKIEQLNELNKKLKEFDKELRKNKFSELTIRIWEQEKNIVRIKMNIQNAEKEKISEETQKKELPDEMTRRAEKTLNEPVIEYIENKQEQHLKHLGEFNAKEANNYERMNVKDFIEQKNNGIQSQDEQPRQEPLLSPEMIAQMDEVVNNVKEAGENKQEQTNKYAEVIERVKQKEKQKEENQNDKEKENTIQIKYKSELENIKKYLKSQDEKSEDEIDKKIKRKTLKNKFTELGKKVLKKIGDWFTQEENFEEENALLEASINEKKGRSK